MICKICKEDIKDGATKCIRCNSVYDENGDILNSEKYKELFFILDKENKTRQDSLSKKDDKANRYILLLTLIFGIVSFIVKWATEQHDLPKFLDYIILGVFLISVMCFAVSIFRLLLVFQGLPIKKMVFDDDEITLFIENKSIDYYNRLIDWCKNEFADTEKQINEKDKRLKSSHFMLMVTLVISAIVVLLSFVSIVQSVNNNNQKGGITAMVDNNKTQSTSTSTVVQVGPAAPVKEVAPKVIAKPVNSNVHMFSEHAQNKQNREEY